MLILRDVFQRRSIHPSLFMFLLAVSHLMFLLFNFLLPLSHKTFFLLPYLTCNPILLLLSFTTCTCRSSRVLEHPGRRPLLYTAGSQALSMDTTSRTTDEAMTDQTERRECGLQTPICSETLRAVYEKWEQTLGKEQR